MDCHENYRRWLNSDCVDDESKFELYSVEDSDDEISSRFSSRLEFGTSGLRGLMRAGTNGMNILTVRHASAAVANIIKEKQAGGHVVIAYDSRHNSRLFAVEAARVFAASGINVMIFESLRPTPELSFAVRETGAAAGINITASHNTKEYNGYKVYWSDGAQVASGIADEISREMDRIDILGDIPAADVEAAVSSDRIIIIGSEIDEAYMENVLSQSINDDLKRHTEEIKIVYTPFHGAGCVIVPEILKRSGFRNIICVEEQMDPDGDFPTVRSPNPEYAEGFELAVKTAEREDADIIIGTDPDSDRCAVMVRNGTGFVPLTANQTGILLLDYIIRAHEENGTLRPDSAVVKSIVTTEMARGICERKGVRLIDTLTGFKYIGEKIDEFERTGENSFLFGFEESYGFLTGTYSRDKDGVLAAMLIAEMAGKYKKMGKDLNEVLEGLYSDYGYYKECEISRKYEDRSEKLKMEELIDDLRNGRMPETGGLKITAVRDYLKGTVTEPESGNVRGTGLPKSNVLFYELEYGCSLVIRPSGTEPKVKVYASAAASEEETALKRLEALRRCGEDLIKQN